MHLRHSKTDSEDQLASDKIVHTHKLFTIHILLFWGGLEVRFWAVTRCSSDWISQGWNVAGF